MVANLCEVTAEQGAQLKAAQKTINVLHDQLLELTKKVDVLVSASGGQDVNCPVMKMRQRMHPALRGEKPAAEVQRPEPIVVKIG